MAELKSLLLCADDFGANRAINAGVLRLVRAGKLSAVSCFTDAPLWGEAGRELLAHADRLLIGLHFNVSQGFGFGERPLGYWIARSVLGTLDVDGLRAALNRQIDKFTAVVGRYPDYIDGHHHVHAFPVVRDVVREAALPARDRPAIRLRDVSTFAGATDAPVKRRVIRCLARLRAAAQEDLSLNGSFAGDYSLSPDAPFRDLFDSWLRCSAPGGLIMCHPQQADREASSSAGQRELAYLASARLDDDLAANGCRLLRERLAPSE